MQWTCGARSAALRAGERRAPGVEHGGEADAGAQVLGIGGDGDQGPGGGLEEEAIDHGLVPITAARIATPFGLV